MDVFVNHMRDSLFLKNELIYDVVTYITKDMFLSNIFCQF